ncbi:hypothetical protein [Flammeovirga aprica]|uniref:Uncharacterized protein n=1 Tax=Flammeovirga aprica JL-4 TaxID=694437 RepID=A0A7X9RSW9_9BACT|nr:hypothetical protein [Flammeovirga aprica]NME66497.1 hypothetical protein [Flammeovirga aprica JL-4]
MKKFKDILKAQQDFRSRRNNFLKINYSLFGNLIKQIYDIEGFPKGAMIKYQYGSTKNTNIIEELVGINDKGNCSMKINIIADGIDHIFDFVTTKENETLTLQIISGNNYENFNYSFNEFTNFDDLDFEDEINYIIQSIINTYDIWKF